MSSADGAIDASFAPLRIRRVAGHIGGEVQNLKLSADLDERSFGSLQSALEELRDITDPYR